MPRSQIPHGNRPRVPAGSEAASFAQPSKYAPHHSRPLPDYVDLGGSGPVQSHRSHLEPVTRKTRIVPQHTSPPQHNMDQTEELARLRAELAALKLSIGQKNPSSAHSTEAVVCPKTVSASTASAPKGIPASQHIPTSFAPASGGLRGSRYAASATAAASAPTTASASCSTLAGHDLVGRGKAASTESSCLTPAASASTALHAPSGGSNIISNWTNSGPFATRTSSQQASKSLLGQDYMPPTKEKFAKRGAVKIVPVEDKAAKAKLEEETASQTEEHDRKHKEAKKVKQEAPRYEEVEKKSEEERRCGDAEIKIANEDALQSEKDVQKLAAQHNHARGTARDTPITTNLGDSGSQSSEKNAAKQLSSERNAPGAGHGDFITNSGRRICISNVPVGASDKDIHQLIEKKANAGQSIETITVFRRSNGQPGYALVDVLTRRDALHIVKWMADERLFGWPIDMRMAHELSKDIVDELLETGSAALMLAHEKPSIEGSVGKMATCRYWLLGHCRNGVSCKYLHGIADKSTSSDTVQSRGHPNGRRNGVQYGRRNYNFDNIPLPAEDGDEETSGSIFGTSVYRPTALRVITDGF